MDFKNKLNSYKARYYTNEAIRRRVDLRLKKMHRLTPLMDATDVTIAELKGFQKEMDRLNGEIKKIDPDFYDEINLISAVS